MTVSPSSGEDDSRRFSRLTAVLVACALTGYATFLVNRGGVWEQWAYLVHTAQGVLLTGILGHFVYVHYRRTVGLRRPAVSVTGILAVVVALVLVASGLHITYFGQFESARGVYWAHVIAATVTLVAVLGHVLWHRATLPAHRREEQPGVLRVESRTLRQTGFQIALACGVILAASVVYSLLPSPYVDQAVIQPYDQTYGADPFAPSHNETESGGFYDVKRLGGAGRCGECHEEIYQDWKASIHSRASSDRAYQTNIQLLSTKKSMAATRYCEGCHAPVAIMSGQLTTGGRLDTPGHMVEGVTCLSCHAIRKVLDTSGVASYLWSPAQDYLFSGYDNYVARKVHNYAVRLNPSLHRRDMARPPLAKPELCATCHAQFMEKVMNDWGWVKMQDDYTAWLKGPFSGQSNHTFAQPTVQRCQDCHFALVPGVDPSANSAGLQRSHRLPGANTAIPFIDGNPDQIDVHTRFLQANRVTVTIDKPTQREAQRSDKHVQADISEVTEPPGYFYLGDHVTINTVTSNTGVGHEFPGGTIDINEVWVHFAVTDGQNRTIFESGALDEHGDVDPAAYFYRSLPVDKEGKLVWRHDLFRMVGDSFRNVIKPGSSDVVTYDFTVPSWAKTPLSVSAIVKYRKLNQRYARWALKDDNIALPIVDVASDAITIPLRARIEASDQQLGSARPSHPDEPPASSTGSTSSP
jgi:hypothetical protein